MLAAGEDPILGLIVDAIDETSARGIAAAVGRLVNLSKINPGDRLPTVRDVAVVLRVSPTTVSHAWRSLARAGLVTTRGRSGTFVRGEAHGSPAHRMLRVFGKPGDLSLDLSTGIPDATLLPDWGPSLARAGEQRFASHYGDVPVLPALEEVLRDRWPFPPERLTVLDGALDALDRVAAVTVQFGDRVLVENPCFPPILDILEERGAQPVPIELDDDGPSPEAVARALAAHPSVFLLQPRAHNPSGVGLSEARARRLADVLAGSSVVVVEDDHAGDISSAPLVSLGSHLPGRVVHIRSFAKSHGPDLRLAAVGGPSWAIDAVDQRRLLGPGWSSRLLQAVLVGLLTDAAATAEVRAARDIYARRRRRVADLLTERGVETSGRDGINLWVAVTHEQSALLVLAADGIGAAPGSPFEVAPLREDHLRLTVGLVPEEDAARVVDALAAAADSPGRSNAARNSSAYR